MNSYERFMTAIGRKEPDMVPIMELEVEESVRHKIMPGASLVEFYENADLDAIVVFEDIPWEEVRPEVKRDHFGILRRFMKTEGPTWPFPVEPMVKNNQNLENFLDTFETPDPHDPDRLATLKALVEKFKGEKAVIFGLHSSFIYPAFIRGIDNLLADYIINPYFAKRLTEKIVDYFVEMEKHAIEYGADAVIECEDYCSKTGPFMSIKHFREFVLPGLIAVRGVAGERNVPFLKHADGYMWSLLDILVQEVGIEAFHPNEPAAGMDMAEVKKAYGDKIAVIGNIDCAHLLTFGNPGEVRKATIECIKNTSPGGGHVLSSSNVIHVGVPPENFLAMVKTAREYGRYPIGA